MLTILPLMILPFLLYNAGMLGLFGNGGVAALADPMFSIAMLSGSVWSMNIGDLLIVVSLLLLFLEILKATRNGRGSLINHMLSMFVFIAYLVEFLLARDAATQVFFILMVITFIDVIGGFTISIRSASRDVSIGL